MNERLVIIGLDKLELLQVHHSYVFLLLPMFGGLENSFFNSNTEIWMICIVDLATCWTGVCF